jgi:hypothetical protein
LPVQSALQNDEIETEILRASSTSEFSHSLDPVRTSPDKYLSLTVAPSSKD